MCFGGGGGASSGTQLQYYTKADGSLAVGEQGLPQAAIEAGVTSVADWQYQQQQQLSDKQLGQQQQIADKQDAFNQQQFAYQQAQAEEQRKTAQEQADRQTTYDTGRSQLLQESQDKINSAFSQFSPDYFKGYADKYMAQAADDIAYQRQPAQREMAFGLARRGVVDSQSGINQAGLLAEDEGRALDKQSQSATDAATALKGNVANAKTSLLSQVSNAESLGSPIAGGNTDAVNSALDTQRRSISGVTNTAGDITATLGAVPTVSPLTNVFGNVLTAAGSGLAGYQANQAMGAYKAGLAGTNPGGNDSVSIR
jgi:hypothetical protein